MISAGGEGGDDDDDDDDNDDDDDDRLTDTPGHSFSGSGGSTRLWSRHFLETDQTYSNDGYLFFDNDGYRSR